MKSTVHVVDRKDTDSGLAHALCGAVGYTLLREREGEPATCRKCLEKKGTK